MITRTFSRFASIPLSLCAAGMLMFAACSSDSKGSEEEVDASTSGATGTTTGPTGSGPTGSKESDGSTAVSGLDGSVVTTPPSHTGGSTDSGVVSVTPGEDASAPIVLLDAGTSDGGSETHPDGGGKLCGTRGAPQGCGPMQFCSFAASAQCGAADQGGTCKTRPQVCEQTCTQAGFCGCDGRHYCNECLAERAGTSVAHEGACAMTPPTMTGKTCGGIAGLKCESGTFCDYEAAAGGQGCGSIADAAGTCQPIPASCPNNTRNPRGPMVEQVCGCDGKTYPSACEAHVKGMSVKAVGACK